MCKTLLVLGSEPLLIYVRIYVRELIPPCVARRREKVGALYSTVSGLLAVISRAYPQFLSPACRVLASMEMIICTLVQCTSLTIHRL